MRKIITIKIFFFYFGSQIMLFWAAVLKRSIYNTTHRFFNIRTFCTIISKVIIVVDNNYFIVTLNCIYDSSSSSSSPLILFFFSRLISGVFTWRKYFSNGMNGKKKPPSTQFCLVIYIRLFSSLHSKFVVSLSSSRLTDFGYDSLGCYN